MSVNSTTLLPNFLEPGIIARLKALEAEAAREGLNGATVCEIEWRNGRQVGIKVRIQRGATLSFKLHPATS